MDDGTAVFCTMTKTIENTSFVSKAQRARNVLLRYDDGIRPELLARLSGIDRSDLWAHLRRMFESGELRVLPDGRWKIKKNFRNTIGRAVILLRRHGYTVTLKGTTNG